MFNDETVFILGAGASEPYGYPLGKELIKKIIDYINNDIIYVTDFYGFQFNNPTAQACYMFENCRQNYEKIDAQVFDNKKEVIQSYDPGQTFKDSILNIKEALNKAKDIIILGFGFHPSNIEILKLGKIFQDCHSKKKIKILNYKGKNKALDRQRKDKCIMANNDSISDAYVNNFREYFIL